MKKSTHPFDYAWAPFALLALFYLGGLWQRPMFDPEYGFAVWAGRFAPFKVRFGSAAATLLTAAVLYLFMKGKDRVCGMITAGIYLSGGVVFAAGTAADSTAYFTLGFTLLLCSLYDVVIHRKFLAAVGAAAGGILAGYAVLQMPVPAFRFAYYGWYLCGLFPWLLFLPVLLDGGLKRSADGPGIDFRTALPRMALIGIAAGFAALFLLREWTAGMPFLALLCAMALQEFAKAHPDMARLDKLIFHWLKLFAMCGILLVVGFVMVKFGKIKPFPLPGNMTISIFALLMLLGWFYMARREKRLEGKIFYIAMGSAFFLCGSPAMMPSRMTAEHAPAEMLRRIWPQDAAGIYGTKIQTTPELANMLRYSRACKSFGAVPLDKMTVKPGQYTVFLVREKEAKQLPPAQRKIVLRAPGLAVLEYNLEYNTESRK